LQSFGLAGQKAFKIFTFVPAETGFGFAELHFAPVRRKLLNFLLLSFVLTFHSPYLRHPVLGLAVLQSCSLAVQRI
jgi:hypothetical protein